MKENIDMRKNGLEWLEKCDRTATNEDGSRFYRFDDEDSGTTTWYDENGNCDSMTNIPQDDW